MITFQHAWRIMPCGTLSSLAEGSTVFRDNNFFTGNLQALNALPDGVKCCHQQYACGRKTAIAELLRRPVALQQVDPA